MTDLEFRQEVLDKLSPSFCAAKWYNATIWLGSGQTTSCHHPPAHRIPDPALLAADPSLIHNTAQKKHDRELMQRGERPAGCEYCWKIEDMGVNAVSDRVYKSKIYPIEALHEARNLPPDTNVNLRTLEIAFDRTCQFACSYCNPAFSSTWVRDIRHNGPYTSLVSDGRNHFTHAHDASQLYSYGESNPYVDAFFAWWESDLHRTLQELRITGGEPLMSGHTWKLIDWFANNPNRSKTRLAINSNLGAGVDVTRLLVATQDIDVEIYTSMEATGAQAEYIRDGLDYAAWQHNVTQLLDAGRTVHFMATINALCLESLTDHLEYLVKLKKRYNRDRVNFTLNILRFPSFQSPLVLSTELKNKFRDQLIEFVVRHKGYNYMHEHEIAHTQRLIDYLDTVKTPHSDAFELPKLHNDFQQFYAQYNQRRGKHLINTFPQIGSWYEQLQI